MHIKSIKLQNFRCFDQQQFDVDRQFVVIQGCNGSGKTSILEALHYSCYLRSFRTHLNRDLVELEKKHFFIQVDFSLGQEEVAERVQIGFSEKEGKLVKLNQKPVQSYKELISAYRIVSLTAEDISLVSGSPEQRRDFLNYSLMLQNPAFLQTLKRAKQITEQRTSILCNDRLGSSQNLQQELAIWSEKLWEETIEIQRERREYLAYLEQTVNQFLQDYFVTPQEDLRVKFLYSPKNMQTHLSFGEFWEWFQGKFTRQELSWRRTLFGSHLDDFTIIFQNKAARIFASRGQQKLIVFLIKIAQLCQTEQEGEPGVLLLDDFLTDFDQDRIKRCFATLQNFNFQVFLTSPIAFDEALKGVAQHKICQINLEQITGPILK
ncbi:DNA replication and repair protein RecF [Candidatus Babeliales bacterium]|nr:DNA replication and repair protein RecF [Candidatus Babeliales bacterium]MBY0353475.1 DNA replication and repair protein RecF [Candidatus Babeliales bacterium]